jgi:hypothetical protein
MGPGVFWGIVLMLLGLSIILKVAFNIKIPVFRLLIAFLFIFIGLKIIFGRAFIKINSNEADILFAQNTIKLSGKIKNEYNIIFGGADFIMEKGDTLSIPGKKIKINTIFGTSTLRLNDSIPIKVNVNAAFAGAKLPGSNTTVLGTATYASPGITNDQPRYVIEADVVFGSFKLIQQHETIVEK